MPDHRDAAPIVREWVRKAENDLVTAAHTLKLGAAAPTDTICFHVQQCVEKYVKALLIAQGMDVPKSHNLVRLFDLLPVSLRPTLSIEDQVNITSYATDARYPDLGEATLAEARRAVSLARRVRREIRRRLPRAALVLRKPRGKKPRKSRLL